MDFSEHKYSVVLEDVEEMKAELEALTPAQLTDRDHQFLKMAEALTGGKVFLNMRHTIAKAGFFGDGHSPLLDVTLEEGDDPLKVEQQTLRRIEADARKGFGLPRLALGRATARNVRCIRSIITQTNSRTSMTFSNLSTPGALSFDPHYVMSDIGYFPSEPPRGSSRFAPSRVEQVSGDALVPMVPPRLRPADGLDDCFVLFEVDQWANVDVMARATAVDPILCRRLANDIFIVEAIWDMTKLEALATGL